MDGSFVLKGKVVLADFIWWDFCCILNLSIMSQYKYF